MRTSISAVLFPLYLILSVPAWAGYNTATPEEFKAMEPVCQAIGMGEINGVFWAEALKDSPILDRPENVMAKGAVWFHHYCWGKLAKLRYYTAPNSEKRNFELAQWRKEMQYIVDWTGQHNINWAYLPLIHKEIAQSFLYDKDSGMAIIESQKALDLDPDYAPAYEIMADAYSKSGKRAKALEIATEGLEHNPDSKPLQRRYKEFGGKLPYPKPKPRPVPALDSAPPVAPPVSASSQSAPPPNSPANAVSVQPQAAPPPAETGKNAVDGANPKHPPNNPYCRFCP